MQAYRGLTKQIRSHHIVVLSDPYITRSPQALPLLALKHGWCSSIRRIYPYLFRGPYSGDAYSIRDIQADSLQMNGILCHRSRLIRRRAT